MAARLKWETNYVNCSFEAWGYVSKYPSDGIHPLFICCNVNFSRRTKSFNWKAKLRYCGRTLADSSGNHKDIRDAMNAAEAEAPILVTMALEDAERLYGKLVKVNERNKLKEEPNNG